MRLPMFCNSAGKRDAMLTAAVMGLGVVLLKFALAGVTLTHGVDAITVGAFDAGGAGVILAATFSAYVARRNGWGTTAPKEA